MAGSREFYREVDGKKEDAFLHDAILANPDADRASLEATRLRMLGSGLTQAEIDALYPLEAESDR